MESSFGAFFDPLADKILTLTLLWLFVFTFHSLFYLIVALVMSVYDVTTTTLRLTGFKSRSLVTSHIAKLKTAVLMAGLLVALCYGGIGISAVRDILGGVSDALLAMAAILSIASLLNYLRPPATALEKYESLESIDFAAWHAQGIECVLFDAEGTLVSWRNDKIPAQIALSLQRARHSGIAHLALISNIPQRRRPQIEAIAAQMHATLYRIPERRGERKPSARMIQAALRDLNIPPASTAFVGDKWVDVFAARRAGLQRVAWVNRLGDNDHPFDRLVYRRVEPLVKWMLPGTNTASAAKSTQPTVGNKQ